MNFDILDETDSWSTLLEKEKELQAPTNHIVEPNTGIHIFYDGKDKEPLITKSKPSSNINRSLALKLNLLFPIITIIVGVIVFFCFNSQIYDKCGCEFSEDVGSNPNAGNVYFICVSANYWCYRDIKLYE